MPYSVLEAQNRSLHQRLWELEQEKEQLLAEIDRKLHPTKYDRYGNIAKGYKGGNQSDAGYIYCPYIPMATTPLPQNPVHALFS